MAIYKFSEARQNLASLLQAAVKDGKVMILRKDGIIFGLRSQNSKRSPLDVEGVDVDVSSEDILSAIHDGKSRSTRKPEKKQMRKKAS